MTDTEDFEAQRSGLIGLAYRMLGSRAEAEDAVQEAWLRLHRAGEVENLPAWLHTVVSRICLDQLRARAARPEGPWPEVEPEDGAAPEEDAVLADSVGRALLVVLDRLGPAERVAFVLHDLFAVPFERIATVLDRSTGAAKKLASRARARVRGTSEHSPAELREQRAVVEAFLAAARDGDLQRLLTVLAPDVVRTADPVALPAGAPAELRGSRAVAEQTVLLSARSRSAVPALVDGAVGLVLAPYGRLRLAIRVRVHDGLVTRYEVLADPDRLRAAEFGVLEN
ncbi:sigma-70 family RNA polymerase sigma factor [Sciscionella sediminilitoris]|uniref:sigma-70 family RNA polymerase sigma factor n=1 Tax=Sciscionella sediminilitoris TaxID=1445613 RepID=UPI0004DF85FE|nr:sigma-70 family RNA polymerase sigma factor [Sciscionella sp. SE31]